MLLCSHRFQAADELWLHDHSQQHDAKWSDFCFYVRTTFKQQANCGFVTFPGSIVQCGPIVVIVCFYIGTTFKQPTKSSFMIFPSSKVQHGPTIGILLLLIGTAFKQQTKLWLHDLLGQHSVMRSNHGYFVLLCSHRFQAANELIVGSANR